MYYDQDNLGSKNPKFLNSVRKGDIEAVIKFIDSGADVNDIEYEEHWSLGELEGNSALQIAIEEENIDMVKLLIGAGADLSYMDADAWNALSTAAWIGNSEIVDILIRAGAVGPNYYADHNNFERGANNPLELALDGDNSDVVKTLIDAGEVLYVNDSDGMFGFVLDQIQEFEDELSVDQIRKLESDLVKNFDADDIKWYLDANELSLH